MSETHLSREFLEAIENGALGPAQAGQWLTSHTLALCPTCRREWEAFQVCYRGGPGVRLAIADALLGWLRARLEAMEPALQRGLNQAERAFEELLCAADHERQNLVNRYPARFQRSLVVERLLAAAHRGVREDPWLSLDLARLAFELAWRLPPAEAGEELAVRALAQWGNALRVQGLLCEAAGEFEAARSLARRHGVTDLRVLAELDRLEGVLRGTQRRGKEAVGLLQRAILQFSLDGDLHEAAATRVALSAQLQKLGEPGRAVFELRSALTDLDTHADPRLALTLSHNLALYLCDLGHFSEARTVFEESRALYTRFDDFWTRLRGLWLEARLVRSQGLLARAERLLEEVRAGFLAQGIEVQAALVGLDLSELHLSRGQSEQARELAASALAVLNRQEVEQERQRAAALLHRAELGLTGWEAPCLTYT